MSAGSRIIIAAISMICAAGFYLTALDPSDLPAGAHVFYGMAMLCVVIAIASLFPKSHPITLRMIGTIIFCGYITYVIDSIQTYHLVRALVGLIICGFPAGYVAIKGRYPRWGELSQVLR